MGKTFLLIGIAGGVGGLANALLGGGGLILPQMVAAQGQGLVLVPGVVGNLLVGLLAAVVSYALYGPAAALPVFGTKGAPAPTTPVTYAALAGAFLVGFSGGRWISTQAEKQISQATALAVTKASEKLVPSKAGPTFTAANSQAIQGALGEVANSLQKGTPAEAYEKAEKLRQLVEAP